MYLSTHPSFHTFTHPSNLQPILYPKHHASMHPPTHPSNHQSSHIFMHLSSHFPSATHLHIHASVYPSICLSFHLFISPYIHTYIHVSIHPTITLSFHLLSINPSTFSHMCPSTHSLAIHSSVCSSTYSYIPTPSPYPIFAAYIEFLLSSMYYSRWCRINAGRYKPSAGRAI